MAAAGFDHSAAPHFAHFGGEVSPTVAQLLREAAASYGTETKAEAILWSAQAIEPHCLPVYFSLYKFYFYKHRLEDAERVARMALVMAAGLGGFDADWKHLGPDSAPWSDTTSPAHFYAFSLKALAFIRLRRGDHDECQALLEKLNTIDPRDSVGWSVIRSFALAV